MARVLAIYFLSWAVVRARPIARTIKQKSDYKYCLTNNECKALSGDESSREREKEESKGERGKG